MGTVTDNIPMSLYRGGHSCLNEAVLKTRQLYTVSLNFTSLSFYSTSHVIHSVLFKTVCKMDRVISRKTKRIVELALPYDKELDKLEECTVDEDVVEVEDKMDDEIEGDEVDDEIEENEEMDLDGDFKNLKM
ncbi:hypothetical protein HHI36_004986 [Cryptolaemus montrouzieri]|uniref:Uncharacterized protein n=1 Tax=Cryptolaemus montrouzieri TaxID=559131 RepID=A0ABD2NT39_9CUCU